MLQLKVLIRLVTQVEQPSCKPWRALDDAAEVPSAHKDLKCSRCGSGKVSTRPQLHDRTIDEIRAAAHAKQVREGNV